MKKKLLGTKLIKVSNKTKGTTVYNEKANKKKMKAINVCYLKKKVKKKNQQWVNALSIYLQNARQKQKKNKANTVKNTQIKNKTHKKNTKSKEQTKKKG